MRIRIRTKIFFFTIITSIIFILFTRVMLIEAFPNKYLEAKEDLVHNKIANKINSMKDNSEDEYEKVITEIKSLKETEGAIEEIQISKEENLDLLKLNNKNYGKYRVINTDKNNSKEINELIYFLNNSNTVIRVRLNKGLKEELDIGMRVAFKFISIFLFIFSCLFSILIGYVITRKANNINRLSRRILEGEFQGELDKDIITDEFDDLVETINKITQISRNDVKGLEREKLYKKQLMLSISHEIKTPIGGLNGILEGMLDNISPYTDRDKYIRECRKLSSRLGQIANEMLDVTKLDSVPTEREEVCVRIMLEEIVEGFNSMVLSKNIDVIIDIDYRISIFTDKRIFKRSIVNIIENAIKYSNLNSKVIIKSNESRIEFYNECDGLTNEDLEFVFNPLYRGSTRKNVGGRGIGLYIVKECLTALNIPHKIENYKKGVLFKIDLKGEEKWD